MQVQIQIKKEREKQTLQESQEPSFDWHAWQLRIKENNKKGKLNKQEGQELDWKAWQARINERNIQKEDAGESKY